MRKRPMEPTPATDRAAQQPRPRCRPVVDRGRPNVSLHRHETGQRMATPVERPVQAVVRRRFRSQPRAAATARMPEGNDNKLSVQDLVVDVIPNSGQIQATQPRVMPCTRSRTDPGLARKQGNSLLKIDADSVWCRWPVLYPPCCSCGGLYRSARSYLNDEHFAQAIRRRRSSISAAEMVSPLAA